MLVTGTAPQEGKTTTLVNLAKLLAVSGEKTVVVDFDLRRAQLHSRLGLTREPGLTDFFVKHEDLDALIRPTRVPNLFALTAGPLPPEPARAPGAARGGRSCSTSCAGTSTGCWWTRRRWPR